MGQYVEYAVHEEKNRSNWVTAEQVIQVANVALSKSAPMYASIWLMDDSVKELQRLRRTVKSYKGLFALQPRIILDVDRGGNTDDFVFNQTCTTIAELKREFPWFEQNHQVWYSGTGYHIVIPEVFGFDPAEDLPETLKATMKTVFPWVDQAIYTRSAMVRTPMSLNPKSNRYKIPIPSNVFNTPGFTCTDVIEQAEQKPTQFQWYKDFNFNEKPLHDRIVRAMKVFSTSETTGQQREIRETTNIVTCMQTVYNIGEQQGTRHQRLLRLASWLHRQALPIEAAKAALYRYAPSLPTVDVDRIVQDVYDRGYPYSCDDPIMKQFCDPKCIFHLNKNYTNGIKDAASLERRYREYSREMNSAETRARVINLRDYYDMPTDYKFFPGELVTLIGDTKLGKSAWYQNLAVAMAPHRVIYLSLEVHEELMYRRLVQISQGIPKHQIDGHYASEDEAGLTDGMQHIMMSTDAPKLADIVKMITDYRPLGIFIDTLDMVDAGTPDPLQQIEICAKTLKAIANKFKVIIFLVHHIAKNNAQDSEGRPLPMTIHSGKYATTLQQKSDKVIALEGSRGTSRRVVRSLGSRDENDFRLVFDVDWETFRFNQVVGEADRAYLGGTGTTPPPNMNQITEGIRAEEVHE